MATKLAPFTPSGDGVLAFALELLQLQAGDVLVDLGCGDGRMLVHAAKETGARCARCVWTCQGGRIGKLTLLPSLSL